jgi:CHC2 zinc finger
MLIERVKNTIPIMDALERYAGVNFTNARINRQQFNVCCPFHNDGNPSLTIYTETNTFFCWSGCNERRAGDVIDVVKLSMNLTTTEAIKLLVSDYGLKKLNSPEAKKWQKKRAGRLQSAALEKRLNVMVSDRVNLLEKIEKVSVDAVSTIKTMNDMEQFGDLYHIISQVSYWLDCLVDTDPVIQFETLEEVNSFLEKINKKAA